MRNTSDADMALSFHNAAGKAVDPGNLSQVFLSQSKYVNLLTELDIPNVMLLLSHQEPNFQGPHKPIFCPSLFA